MIHIMLRRAVLFVLLFNVMLARTTSMYGLFYT